MGGNNHPVFATFFAFCTFYVALGNANLVCTGLRSAYQNHACCGDENSQSVCVSPTLNLHADPSAPTSWVALNRTALQNHHVPRMTHLKIEFEDNMIVYCTYNGHHIDPASNDVVFHNCEGSDASWEDPSSSSSSGRRLLRHHRGRINNVWQIGGGDFSLSPGATGGNTGDGYGDLRL